MGVAGSGKSLIGGALAHALDLEFVEGDEFHSRQNIQKMSAAIPLTDADRADWLRALAACLQAHKKAGTGIVVTCSALKRAYRDVLRAGASDVQFIFLKGPSDVIAARLKSRGGHFMPASLLDSQLATLEEPTTDENAWVIDITKPPAEIITDLVTRARASQ